MSALGEVGATSTSEIAAQGRGERLVRWWEPRGDVVATVVLVHGYAEHSGRYAAAGAALAREGFAVWATDLGGHGRSSGERASVHALDDLVADVAALVERARTARPGLPVFVLGHSMGGLVATTFALDHPDALAGVVLSGAAVGDPAAIEPLLDLDPLPEVVLSSEMLSRDPRVGEDYDRDPLNYRGPFRRETLRALTAGARRVRERFAELRLPLLVLHGGEDRLVQPAASEDLFAAAASPDKELAVYPELRHEILNEPEGPEIVARVAAWITARAR
jgi:alpha-beta hydrolase superfamily lysophospholipase